MPLIFPVLMYNISNLFRLFVRKFSEVHAYDRFL